MTDETPGTLEELLHPHGLDGGWCHCGIHLRTKWDRQAYIAHLADVVRAWLVEQVNALPPFIARDSFLAALDRRPDGPSEVNGADLRAEQGQVAHGDHDDAAGFSEAVSELRRRLDELDRVTIYGKPISAWLKEAR